MKNWYKSKTIWFNLIVAAMLSLEAGLGQLSALIPANWYAIIAFILPIGNSILRVISSTQLTK